MKQRHPEEWHQDDTLKLVFLWAKKKGVAMRLYTKHFSRILPPHCTYIDIIPYHTTVILKWCTPISEGSWNSWCYDVKPFLIFMASLNASCIHHVLFRSENPIFPLCMITTIIMINSNIQYQLHARKLSLV